MSDRRPRGIVLLEGADCSGKTTLARHLVERHGARYLHGRVFPDMWRYHVAMLRRAVRLADDHLVVIDRLWPSELIYGPIYRGSAAYDLGARCLDRVLRRAGAVYILAVPADVEDQVRRHAVRRNLGEERFPRVRAVIDAYRSLAWGHELLTSGYGSHLAACGGLLRRSDVVLYDWQTTTLESAERAALSTLRRVRASLPPAALDSRRYNLAGNPRRASCLLVGDRVSPRVIGPRDPRWPLCHHDGMCAATYLNAALQRLNVLESALALTNANELDDQLADLIDLTPRVVALGELAARRLRQLGADFHQVPHPQWWRRFRFHDTAGYDHLLRSALS